jgi:hypothetical protein
MRTRYALCLGITVLFATPTAFAQNAGGPANEINCPSTANQAAPPFVGPGTTFFSRNQSLCLPQLAPVGPTPQAFVVQGGETGIRVDSQAPSTSTPSAACQAVRIFDGGTGPWDGIPTEVRTPTEPCLSGMRDNRITTCLADAKGGPHP